MTGGSSSGASATEATNLVFRIASVGLSLASAIMTATSTHHDAGRPAATVSYADYPSLRYAAAADLVSAVLQGVAICLEAAGKKKAAKAVELIDKLVLALTSTSAALLLAVDEITSCGPRRTGEAPRRQGTRRIRVASALSIAGTVSVSVSVYTRRAPEAVPAVVTALSRRRRRHVDDVLPPPPPPTKKSPPDSPKTKAPPKPPAGPSSPPPPFGGCSPPDSPKTKTPPKPPAGPSSPPPPFGGCDCDGKPPCPPAPRQTFAECMDPPCSTGRSAPHPDLPPAPVVVPEEDHVLYCALPYGSRGESRTCLEELISHWFG